VKNLKAITPQHAISDSMGSIDSYFDFAALSESLGQRLTEQKLSTTGLCPERHELYKDCFDEVVLELTNIDPDEGALLSRIRDELNMTSDAYKKLYESSVSFGLTKAIEARHQNEKLHDKIDEILQEKMVLLDQNEYLKRKLSVVQKDEEKKREREMSRYKLELRRLKNRNEQIKRGLEHCLVNGAEQVSNISLDTTQQ
jgi:dynein light intermediate chain